MSHKHDDVRHAASASAEQSHGLQQSVGLPSRGFMSRTTSRLSAGVLALMMTLPLLCRAEDPNTVSGDKTTDMVVDVVIVRPLGFAATVIGSVLTVVALPFTIPSGSVKESAEQMIVKPAEYTFKRPLGEFDQHDP